MSGPFEQMYNSHCNPDWFFRQVIEANTSAEAKIAGDPRALMALHDRAIHNQGLNISINIDTDPGTLNKTVEENHPETGYGPVLITISRG